jgi:hypothetical protein
MESNWAADHLQVIRTLMERASVYRRALAPVMIYNGCLGLAAASAGVLLRIFSPRGFIFFWAGVAVLGLIGSLLLVRRQSLRDKEPFWSSPTRRVTLAMLPPVAAGFVLSVIVLLGVEGQLRSVGQPLAALWLPSGWVVLYGCAFHAAGFFMPRGMRLFGWIFIAAGCALFWLASVHDMPQPECGHIIMGAFFGLLHLAYGVYLRFTEPRGDDA